MRNIIIATLIVLGIIVTGCAAPTKLVDYKPTTEGEEEVLAFMVECDQAFQNKDMTKYSDCFHENASIMIFEPGGFQRVSKQDFYEIRLKNGRGSFPWQQLVTPKLKSIKIQHKYFV